MTVTRSALLLALGCAALALLAACDGDDPVRADGDDDGLQFVDQPFTIGADEYLRDRFFRLDLPEAEAGGRVPGERIDPASLRVYRRQDPGPAGPNDVVNIAAYVDSTGFRNWPGVDFAAPHATGALWRELADVRLMLDGSGELLAIDLLQEWAPGDVLAVTYEVIDAASARHPVGDGPERGPPTQQIPGLDGLFYRAKLLKAPAGALDPHAWGYPLRNVYALGGAHLDPEGLTLEIAANDPLLPDPTHATPDIPWIRLFGLDSMGADGGAGPDGVADIVDPERFDLQRGLVVFPFDMPQPFAAAPAQYELLAAPDSYPYAGSYLAATVMPEIYSMQTPPEDLSLYRRYVLRGVRRVVVGPDDPFPGQVPLSRSGWMRAALPQPVPGGTLHLPASRADHVRWFAPRERVLARYLNPTLTGAARDETIEALDLYLRDDDGWSTEHWGGITTGLSPTGADLTRFTMLEIWVNDHRADPAQRRGRLHVDVGRVSEDGFWPRVEGGLVVGAYEREDANGDGVWVYDEDIGLDGDEFGPERYDSAYEIDGDAPYPRLNGTARNSRQDDEDLNGDTMFGRDDAYFAGVIPLAGGAADIDVVRDYEDVQDLVAAGIAWRRYRIRLADMAAVDAAGQPRWDAATHLRVWYDDDTGLEEGPVHLQIGPFRFVE